MAIRKVYRVSKNENDYVDTIDIEFKWNAGFAVSQKQKNIVNLHDGYKQIYKDDKILEISTKSKDELGVRLSAFNLSFVTKNNTSITVESAFQSSKKFENGGPYKDIITMDSKSAKKDPRLKNSGDLVSFVFKDYEWPLNPKTLFYDWLYMNSLHINKDLVNQIINYDAFTDIEFNPNKSINCQAYSAALYVSLFKRGIINDVLSSRDVYIDFRKKSFL